MSLIFPLWHVGLTASIMAGLSFLLLGGARKYFKVVSPLELLLLAIVAGFSVLTWREVGNTTPLNADPIAGISPNDVLCPVITYVFLSLYSAVRVPTDAGRWAHAQAALALLSFVVNVVTI